MRTPAAPEPEPVSGTGWPDESEPTGDREAAAARGRPGDRAGQDPAVAVRRRVIVCAAGFVAVAALGIALRDATVPGLDGRLHAFALRHRAGELSLIARGVTEGGSTRLVWPLMVVAALTFPRTRGPRSWAGALTIGALAGAAIAVRLLVSIVVHRQRPPQADWLMPAGGYAFPSGHTTAATLGAGFLAWAVTRHIADRRGRVAVWALAVGYAGLVGWSRIWLGVHWPLDVLGGWVFGTAWLVGLSALMTVAAHRLPGWLDPIDADRRDADGLDADGLDADGLDADRLDADRRDADGPP